MQSGIQLEGDVDTFMDMLISAHVMSIHCTWGQDHVPPISRRFSSSDLFAA